MVSSTGALGPDAPPAGGNRKTGERTSYSTTRQTEKEKRLLREKQITAQKRIMRVRLDLVSGSQSWVMKKKPRERTQP